MLERDILLINYTENSPKWSKSRKDPSSITAWAQLQAQQQNLSHAALTGKQLRGYDNQLKNSRPWVWSWPSGVEVAVNREIYTMLEKQHPEALIRMRSRSKKSRSSSRR